MKKYGVGVLLLAVVAALAGYGGIGAKAASASNIYGAAAILAALVIAVYLCVIRKKDGWFLLLFSSIFIVNTGYLALSVSRSVESALLSNRLAYLGSVFLPAAMLMIILNTCRIGYRRWLPWALAAVGTAVFLVAASPGYLDIYYKEVSLTTVNGMTVLEKVYGPWHRLYLVYLLAYFAATAGVLIHASVKKSMESVLHAFFMGAAVFVNMGVWLLEQLVRIDFELLSVSYIVSELFLLLLCLLLQSRQADRMEAPEADAEPEQEPAAEAGYTELPDSGANDAPAAGDERLAYFAAQRLSLTPTERAIYNLYLAGKTTKEVLAELNIKENTLKFHNKNIYGKLGVSSRKELLQYAHLLKEA